MIALAQTLQRRSTMFRRIILVFVAITCAALVGCGLNAVMWGVDEPDLTLVTLEKKRSDAERIVGRPLWRVGTEHDITYDIYQYEAAYPGMHDVGSHYAAGWATVAYLMFAPVFELWLHVERTHLNRSKQVAIGYDTDNTVRFVSMPWEIPRETIGAARKMRSLIPPDAGVPLSARPAPLGRAAGVAPEDATLDVRVPRRIIVLINGEAAKGRRLILPPGRHSMEVRPPRRRVIADAVTLGEVSELREIEFMPGRQYTLRYRKFNLGFMYVGEVLWIEDAASGEAIDAVRIVKQ